MKKLIIIMAVTLLFSVLFGVTAYAAEIDEVAEENTAEAADEFVTEEVKTELLEEKNSVENTDKQNLDDKENNTAINTAEELSCHEDEESTAEKKAVETAGEFVAEEVKIELQGEKKSSENPCEEKAADIEIIAFNTEEELSDYEGEASDTEEKVKSGYSLTFSNGTSSYDTAGGTQVAVKDILAGLGYSVEDAVITVDPDSVDTTVIQITDSDDGPIISDYGPFSKADKNLIVYIDGVSVELSVIDPTDISGNKSTSEVQDAFNDVTDGNVKLTGNVTVTGAGTITLANGTHELFLENCTLTDGRSDQNSYLFTIGDGVILNIYRKGDNGKITGSEKLFEVTGTGTLNYVAGTISASSGTGISGKGTSISYGGEVNAVVLTNDNTYYFIGSDITGTWTISATNVYIDLNGKTLNGNNSNSVITINENKSLTLTDSTGSSGKITCGKQKSIGGGGVYVNGATFTMNGGCITYNESNKGGGIYAFCSTFILNGGKISYNKAADNSGGGVYVCHSKFTMNGGSIKSNESMYGAGVYVDSSAFTMNAGEICGNIATRNGGGVHVLSDTFVMNGGSIKENIVANYGGGVYNSSGTFTMNDGIIAYNESIGLDSYYGYGGGVCSQSTSAINGGTIEHNKAKSGGGIYILSKTTTINGGKISENTATVTGDGVYCESSCILGGTAKIISNDKSNLYLPSDIAVTVSSDSPLTTGASIGVTLQDVIGDVTGENSNDYSQYFKSDLSDCYVKNSGSYKVVIAKDASVPIKYDIMTEDIVVEEVKEITLNNAQKHSADMLELNIVKYVLCTFRNSAVGFSGKTMILSADLLNGIDLSAIRVWYITEDGEITEIDFDLNSNGEIVISNALLGLYMITSE